MPVIHASPETIVGSPISGPQDHDLGHRHHHPAIENLKGELSECAGCGSPILDRYYLLAVDRRWHSNCLKCSHCMVSLDAERTCFSREGHIFCKEDYYKMFAVKRCTRCGQGIYANDLVMRARDNIYHVGCFTCAWCNTTLSQGDYYGINNNLVYCRTHFEMRSATAGCGGPFDGRDFFLSSEHAVHPSAADCQPNDPVTGLPAVYAAMYGSPVNGTPGGGLAGGAGPTTAPVRKGRPRKRKSPVVGADGNGSQPNAAGSCSMLDGGPSSSSASNGQTSQNISGCSLDSLSGGPLHEASTPNGGQASCHVSGRTKRMRTSFKHHQLRTMKQYFAINQNPDAKDLKQLAQKTSLSKRVLQVWFQNARAKWRRNNLKHEQNGGGCLGQGMQGDNSQTSQGLSGQSLTGLGPGTPSTGIGSPCGSSTRQFSSPSPSMTSGMHGSQDGSAGLAGTCPGSAGSSLDQFPVSSAGSSLLRQQQASPPPPQSALMALSHLHHHLRHPSSLSANSVSESIIPSAMTGFQELF